MATGFIFPTSVYGALSEVFGTAVSAYANTPGGFPQGSGIQLGMFGVLFDGTICRMLKAASTLNQYDAATFQAGNSNDYTVQQTNAVNQFVMAVNDRSGSNGLVANNIAWFTTRGLATCNVGASIPSNTQLVSSTAPGQLSAYTPGTANTSNGVITGNSTQLNISLLNPSTSAGAYPVRIG